MTTTQSWRDHLHLRKYTTDDIAFMQTLYASIREPELAMTNFNTQERHEFISQQFMAQYIHYTKHYCTDKFFIVEIAGQPVGRVFVDHWDNEIRIVDIALMPEHRGQGLGTHLFQQVMDDGKRLSLPVSVHVERNNPARFLYERLGFKLKTERDDVYLLMEWRPNTL